MATKRRPPVHAAPVSKHEDVVECLSNCLDVSMANSAPQTVITEPDEKREGLEILESHYSSQGMKPETLSRLCSSKPNIMGMMMQLATHCPKPMMNLPRFEKDLSFHAPLTSVCQSDNAQDLLTERWAEFGRYTVRDFLGDRA
ncbi:hypothetical protein Ciccas_012161 [Cichlidogyrus casuarinus]|uniref:Uncharacterized protein n=1 Tax=Cichlidogyrus casuarinus TaxID=1844966 RepID=A0ABD2PQY5_9PLAT